jgi:hypothetical protein
MRFHLAVPVFGCKVLLASVPREALGKCYFEHTLNQFYALIFSHLLCLLAPGP